MGELNISPPGWEKWGAGQGKESINGANLHICFSKNSRFRVFVQNGTFCIKLETSCARY